MAAPFDCPRHGLHRGIAAVGVGGGAALRHAAVAPWKELSQQNAEGVDVGPLVDGGALLPLLRSPVAAGAGRLLEVGPLAAVAQAEVDELHLPLGTDEDVGRLEVAVHDTAGVVVVHGVEELQRHLAPPAGRRLPREPPVERLALDMLHDDAGP